MKRTAAVYKKQLDLGISYISIYHHLKHNAHLLNYPPVPVLEGFSPRNPTPFARWSNSELGEGSVAEHQTGSASNSSGQDVFIREGRFIHSQTHSQATQGPNYYAKGLEITCKIDLEYK